MFHALSLIARARGVTIALGKICPMTSITPQTDPEGRFLFIKGILHGQGYTLASIYAPNTGKADFLVKTLGKLDKFKEGCVIIGGDLNVILDPKLDTTAEKTALTFKALKQMKKQLQALHLVDSWRALNEGAKDYSYYSKTHKVYSRLDLIMVDQYYL